MTALIPQLNSNLGELAERVRKSLVQVAARRTGSGSGGFAMLGSTAGAGGSVTSGGLVGA